MGADFVDERKRANGAVKYPLSFLTYTLGVVTVRMMTMRILMKTKLPKIL